MWYLSGRRWLSRPDPNAPAPNLSSVPAVYFLYVLGSGGHSAEMIETVKQKFRGQKNQHRRYVISSGDKSSHDMVTRLVSNLCDIFPSTRFKFSSILSIAYVLITFSYQLLFL